MSVACTKDEVPGDVVDKDDCMRVPIEGFDEGVKGLLASSVPKLQFDADAAVDLDRLRMVLHSQSYRVVVHELVCEVSLDKTTFAASRVAHNDHLVYEAVLLPRRGHYYIKNKPIKLLLMTN
jgi:hypothetical protein